MYHSRTCIVIFGREPVPGATKTRLIPALGVQGASVLYSRLLKRQLDVFREQALCPFQLWINGDASHKIFAGFEDHVFQQPAGDLGQRMQHALQAALDKYDHAIIIGTDCPGIDWPYLVKAIKLLEQGSPVVLGPADDGGYVLLGLKRMIPRLFTGIPWGTAEVMEQTRQVLTEQATSWTELPLLFDIDRPEDLQRLPRHILDGIKSGNE